jgi:hypothetical protein
VNVVTTTAHGLPHETTTRGKQPDALITVPQPPGLYGPLLYPTSTTGTADLTLGFTVVHLSAGGAQSTPVTRTRSRFPARCHQTCLPPHRFFCRVHTSLGASAPAPAAHVLASRYCYCSKKVFSTTITGFSSFWVFLRHPIHWAAAPPGPAAVPPGALNACRPVQMQCKCS